ncbi:opsin 1 [Cryptococcus wingfieldii CBS 7118]|uniref:Opsin 1 n=1 Tax=Cryptococcus wingfieldii CBS 7118 TaxID=1295528 RepID=A0A1E3IU86_9TREE|nr:opsin 1 [Cryptococcus wingfieldii CBS 7118]ODN92132.1 opsin 1 [Cryptococcus wingfieldii CBS 7118]
MDYLADFVPTSTISVNPPGGTHTHHPHHSHLPVPTDVFPSATPRLLHATHKGHVAAWVFTAVFAAGLAVSVFLVSRTPKKNRLFHGISSVILLVSTLSYLSLATHIGAGKFVPIYHPPGHSDPLVHLFRQIFTIRYIDAAITLPLILLTLSRLSGVSPATTVTIVIAQLVNVYAAWAGSVAGGWPWSKHGNGAGTKWAWFAIAALAYFAIWSVLFAQGRRAAVHRLRSTQGLFYLLSAHVFVLSAGLGIVWILTEGLNIISVDAELITYGILDVANKVGFTHVLLLLHKADEEGPWTLPDWWAEDPENEGEDGRGVYGAVASVGQE